MIINFSPEMLIQEAKKLKRPKILSAFYANRKITENNCNSKIQNQTNNTNTLIINQIKYNNLNQNVTQMPKHK